jgi:hypothetical protein
VNTTTTIQCRLYPNLNREDGGHSRGEGRPRAESREMRAREREAEREMAGWRG